MLFCVLRIAMAMYGALQLTKPLPMALEVRGYSQVKSSILTPINTFCVLQRTTEQPQEKRFA